MVESRRFGLAVLGCVFLTSVSAAVLRAADAMGVEALESPQIVSAEDSSMAMEDAKLFKQVKERNRTWWVDESVARQWILWASVFTACAGLVLLGSRFFMRQRCVGRNTAWVGGVLALSKQDAGDPLVASFEDYRVSIPMVRTSSGNQPVSASLPRELRRAA
jgi:hypothetical protein